MELIIFISVENYNDVRLDIILLNNANVKLIQGRGKVGSQAQSFIYSSFRNTHVLVNLL